MAVAAQPARVPAPIGIYESASEAPSFSDQGISVREVWGNLLAQRNKSSFLSSKQNFLVFEAKIDQLASLRFGWDSYGADPPNHVASENAKYWLGALISQGIEPSTIVPSAEGGISLYF